VTFFATHGSAPASSTTSPGSAATAGEAAAKVHTILIDSTPQDAVVREGDKVLGKTPMTLDIDPAAAPRRLVMSLDGYSSHTFLPSHEDTRIMVPLAPVPVAQAAPNGAAPEKAAPADKGAKPAVHAAAPPPPPPPVTARPVVPSDINTAR